MLYNYVDCDTRIHEMHRLELDVTGFELWSNSVESSVSNPALLDYPPSLPQNALVSPYRQKATNCTTQKYPNETDNHPRSQKALTEDVVAEGQAWEAGSPG